MMPNPNKSIKTTRKTISKAERFDWPAAAGNGKSGAAAVSENVLSVSGIAAVPGYVIPPVNIPFLSPAVPARKIGD
jgi:hypothetical protein